VPDKTFLFANVDGMDGPNIFGPDAKRAAVSIIGTLRISGNLPGSVHTRRAELKRNTIGGSETLIEDIARIPCRSRLEQNDTSLFVSASAVLCSAWNDTILAGVESNDAIPELDSDLAAPDQKHFVFAVVVMPRELTLKLDQLYFLPIESRDYLRPPILQDTRKILFKRCREHASC